MFKWNFDKEVFLKQERNIDLDVCCEFKWLPNMCSVC